MEKEIVLALLLIGAILVLLYGIHRSIENCRDYPGLFKKWRDRIFFALIVFFTISYFRHDYAFVVKNRDRYIGENKYTDQEIYRCNLRTGYIELVKY